MPTVAARPTTLLSATLRRDGRALSHVLAELGRLYQFHDRDCICCYDVSVAQCRALQLLTERDRLTMNDLAAGLYVDKSTASRVVDALERKGYARRKTHPDDHRAVHLEVTPRGRTLGERIEEDLAVRHAALLSEFSPEVRQAALRLLSRLAQAAGQKVQTVGGKCCVTD